MELEKWFKEKLEIFKDDFDFRLESIILNLTEQICEKMVDEKITRTELAGRLEISPAAVTKILRGNSNFTLRTLLSLADSLGLELNIGFKERQAVPIHAILTSSASEPAIPVFTEEGYIMPDAANFLNMQSREEGYFFTNATA